MYDNYKSAEATVRHVMRDARHKRKIERIYDGVLNGDEGVLSNDNESMCLLLASFCLTTDYAWNPFAPAASSDE